MVECDGARLTHVLLNLCQNAARFTEHGSVSLVCRVGDDPPPKSGIGSTSAMERRAEGERSVAECSAKPSHANTEKVSVTFEVRDTGAGIPPQTMAKLFNQYMSMGGTGIGLYLSTQLVEAMGSEMQAVSPWAESGAPGTSFSFTLRLGLSSPESAESAASSMPDEKAWLLPCTSSTRSSAADAKSETIHDASSTVAFPAHFSLPCNVRALIADDTEPNRSIMCRVFENEFHWHVTEAKTAEEVCPRPTNRITPCRTATRSKDAKVEVRCPRRRFSSAC
jgi:hypothetical protein